MPWRWGWPPWESEQMRADKRRAEQEMQQATVDLTETRRQMARTDQVVRGINGARSRNHFSESMEALFEGAARRRAGNHRR